MSELPKELRYTAGIESALFLKEVLDRIEIPPDSEVPQVEAFELSDEEEPLTRWQIPNTRIVIERVIEGPQRNTFQFTPETVRNAAQFYRIVKALPYRTSGRAISAGIHETYVAATKKKPTQSFRYVQPARDNDLVPGHL